MWLLLTVLAAIIATVIWYIRSPGDSYKLGLLSLFFWGAAIMWLVDHIIAYALEGGQFLEISTEATLLGISVITLALVVWLAVLLISDPKGVIYRRLKK